MNKAKQLALHLPVKPSYDRDDFLVTQANVMAYDMLESWPNWPAPVVLLIGPGGAGKSHLAHIWAEQAGAGLIRAEDLPQADLENLLQSRALVVEDADFGGLDETALFHLINLVRETGSSLLITAQAALPEWGVTLPDLLSRMRNAAPIVLQEPDDLLFKQVLFKLFADRQITIDPAIVDYLVVRLERSLETACQVVAAIDAEALAAGRRITRPMVAKWLSDWFDEPETGHDDDA